MALHSGMWAVCFTDLVGSTEQRARLGDHAGDVLRREHDDIVARAAQEHGGIVVKGTGDGSLIAFGAAAEAVDAAVAIQQAIERWNERGDEPLALRVGISAGDLVYEANDLHGLAANEAARLCALASPDQILVSGLVRAIGGSRITHDLTAYGNVELKGIPEPVAVWSVSWEPAADPRGPPFPALLASPGAMAFSGRTEEIERLTAAWKQARSGSTAAVLLSGEPGIGKTRLAAELAQRAHRQGALVLAGRCDDGLGVPFQPFAEALAWYCDHTAEPTVGGHPGELLRLSDHVARVTPSARLPARTDPETDQYRLFDAVVSWLHGCADAQPVVLVLDDLQWATRPTLLMLRHVVSYCTDARLLIIATYRDTDVDRAHPMASMLADLWRRPGVDRVPISGLDHAETVELLERVGERAADENTIALASALLAETEGNPFFIGEVLRNLVESGGLIRRDGVWTSTVSVSELGIPEGIRDVLHQRLDRLGVGASEILECAAVVGREFEVGVVTKAADSDEGLVVDTIETALASRLVEEAGVDRFRFSHALVRQTLYERLSTSRRLRLHRRIAHHLEDEGRASTVELAYHYGEAAALGEAPRAVYWMQRAGDESMQRFAFDEAVEFFGRALNAEELLDQRDPARRGELLMARGDARNRMAAPGPARDDFVEAAALARVARRPDLLALAACGYGGAVGAFVDPTDAVGPALTAEALAALEPGDSPLRCRLLVRRCTWLSLSPDPAERHAVSTEAVAMARRLHDPQSLIAALSERAIALREANRADEQLAISDEMLALARHIGSAVGECDAHERRASAFAKLGELDKMWDTANQVRGLAAEIKFAERQWSAAANLAIVAILRGAFDDAVELIAEEARFAPAYGVIGELTVGLHQHLMTLARGNTEQCAVLMQELCDSFPIFTAIYPAPADIARWEGRLEDCRAALEFWWHNVLPFLPAQFRAYTLTSMAQSATAVNAAEIVAAIHRELLPRAGTWTGSPNELTFYCVDHSLGWCALTMGNDERGVKHLRDAMTFYDRAGSPVLVAHAVADLSDLGHAEPAELDRAMQIADTLALDGIASRLERSAR